MKGSGASSRKRKSAALESIDTAPAAIVALVPLPGAGEDDGGAGEKGGAADRLNSLPDGTTVRADTVDNLEELDFVEIGRAHV